jgi:hypothetical protein
MKTPEGVLFSASVGNKPAYVKFEDFGPKLYLLNQPQQQ